MRRHKYLIVLNCIVCLLCLVPTLYGQKVWEKPQQEWSFMDVMKILGDSPWAKTQHERSSFTWAITSLRSALPIRQALVKQQKVLQSYDKFSPADKARFDAAVNEFLECPDCAKYYIVAVSSPSYETVPTKPKGVFDIFATFKESPLDELKPYIFLINDKGERRELARFIPPMKEDAVALFLFPRFDDRGKPLVSVENKSFSFMIDEKLFRGRSVPVKKVSFDVSQMIKNGEVVF